LLNEEEYSVPVPDVPVLSAFTGCRSEAKIDEDGAKRRVERK
jgi:hypothetical protein